MNLELVDTMPFGKYKSRKIQDVFKENVGYLVWLRETRKKENNDTKFFSREVSALLDMAIRESKQLQKQFKPWDLPVVTEPRTEPTVEEPSNEAAYKGTWGAF